MCWLHLGNLLAACQASRWEKVNFIRTNSNITVLGLGVEAVSHTFEENNPRGLKEFHNFFFSFTKSTIKTDHIKQK